MGKREGKDKLKVQGQKENSGKAAKKNKQIIRTILIIVRLFNNSFQKIIIVCGYRSFSY